MTFKSPKSMHTVGYLVPALVLYAMNNEYFKIHVPNIKMTIIYFVQMFPILEGLSDGAVKLGIPRQTSIEIAAQVMKGAGELLLHEKLHPGVLKDKVCSPGGTTIAGIAELEKGGIRTTIISAVEAATKRGEELAEASKIKKLGSCNHDVMYGTNQSFKKRL